MPKSQKKQDTTDTQAEVTSQTSTTDHLQIMVSGRPEHVMAALTSMSFHQPVTPLLCLKIALAETNASGAQPSSKLGDLNMKSPESRTAYTQRCTLSLKAQTGYNVDPAALPQDATTTVQQVAEAMYDATT